LLVVASVYPLASIAQQIGGERVEVAWWIESGQELAGYQPSPAQIEQMRRAVAILSNGVAEGPYTDQFANAFGDRRLIRLDRFAEWGAGESQLWLNTAIVAQAARELGDRLAAVDPAHGDEYRQRAAECVKQLDSLGDYGKNLLTPLHSLRVGSIGKDYSALGKQHSFVIEPLSRASLLTFDAQAIATLPDTIKAKQSRIMLVEADIPLSAVAALEQTVAIPVARIDSLGSSSPQGRDSYDRIMRYNYEQLAAALRRGNSR